ncbi:MAG: site-specific integrase [Deferribacteraceae bacterium]|nr:site-specific integrase [Deferribacteraceae bacterium]
MFGTCRDYGATFHDLRRTFATYLMEEGVSLYTIKDLLGHSSITMTEIYLASHGTVFKDSVSKIAFR